MGSKQPATHDGARAQERGEDHDRGRNWGGARSGTGHDARFQPLPEIADERVRAWRDWLARQVVRAGYAAFIGGGPQFTLYGAALSRRTGIHHNMLAFYVRRGQRPSAEACIKLADALGLEPLAVLYRAGVIDFAQMAQFLGPAAYALMTRDRYEAEMVQLRDQFEPFGLGVPEYVANRLRDEFAASRRLQQGLSLSDAEWATFVSVAGDELARERARAEITGSTAPFALPSLPGEIDGTLAETNITDARQPGPRHHAPADAAQLGDPSVDEGGEREA